MFDVYVFMSTYDFFNKFKNHYTYSCHKNLLIFSSGEDAMNGIKCIMKTDFLAYFSFIHTLLHWGNCIYITYVFHCNYY